MNLMMMNKRSKRKKLIKEIKNLNYNTKGLCKDKNQKELVYEIHFFIIKHNNQIPTNSLKIILVFTDLF